MSSLVTLNDAAEPAPRASASALEPIKHLKLPAGPEALAHREFVRGPFWQRVPAYREVEEAQFLDHAWQAKHSITQVAKLTAALRELVSEDFIRDVEDGFRRSPMSVRVSPYLLSLIDWDDPYADPLRRQFIPLGSRLLPDHPKLGLDSLGEQADSPVPGLTHRYPDKALFLALDTCPVYCRFCTRSYAVGLNTETVDKVHLRVSADRWARAFEYIRERPELEDIVVSGGDAYNLRASQLTEIGETLLAMDNIRRIRFATKGPAVMPQKILTDDEWTDAFTRVVERGRAMHKEVALHTHFNHPNEVTGITKDAMDKLFERGITIRNQSVLQTGVNDTPEVMRLLIKKLEECNVHAYYVYQHDLVRGVEDLRTTLDTALYVERHVRGSTAGFNMPLFIVDAPGGGGKRDVHSFDYYNRTTGISVFTAPAVKPGRYFLYFDPIHLLPPEGRERWADPGKAQQMIEEARALARIRPR